MGTKQAERAPTQAHEQAYPLTAEAEDKQRMATNKNDKGKKLTAMDVSALMHLLDKNRNEDQSNQARNDMPIEPPPTLTEPAPIPAADTASHAEAAQTPEPAPIPAAEAAPPKPFSPPASTLPASMVTALDKAKKITVPADMPGYSHKTPHAVSADQWQEMLQAVQEEKRLSASNDSGLKVTPADAAEDQAAPVNPLKPALWVVAIGVAFFTLLYMIDRQATRWAEKAGEIAPAASGSMETLPERTQEPAGEEAPVSSGEDPLLKLLARP